MSVKSAKVKKFLEITGTESEDMASFFLGRNQQNVTYAINDFFTRPELAEGFKKVKENAKIKVDSKVKSVFNKYKEDSLDVLGKPYIGIDGTVRYIADLGYEPEDLVILALAEFLESPSVGIFKEDPFLINWSRVGANSIEKMHDYIENELAVKLAEESYFKKVYQFTYKFILEKNQRNVPTESAIEYWNLMIPEEYKKELDTFIKFLEIKDHKGITKDQWNMLYPFLKTYHEDPKLSNYDEMQSWPVLMDEFHEWLTDS
ncbi:hypothetical protein OGAPHI_005597 [Ogataea philodendri]|uniref:Defective in cullin neddylation protein n=1 Tax=Ogataea philodendri TaxID=1378263 RepID=A0A9P8T1W6_9ASCO|nr:uncharacterized protein OGAPHI_005597 [Ogataea philodendri]KAH3662345.1 hypothetical protein OGAPHI_005597 [Ogataea philodendri]